MNLESISLRLLRRSLCCLGLLAGWLAVAPTPLNAQLYSSNLDPLISEMEARAAALSNATEKADLKIKKTLDKLLAGFNKKPSTSLATDLKLLGKAAKKLAKLYPEEFGLVTLSGATAEPEVLPLVVDLGTLVQQALDLFGGDLQTLLDEAQALVDTAPAGSCQDKAQAALDSVAQQLADATGAPDMVTAIKILSKAAKSALKGQSLAAAAIECVPSENLAWYQQLFGMTVNSAPMSAYEDLRGGGPDFVAVTLFTNGSISVNMAKQDGSQSLAMYAVVGNPPQMATVGISGTYFEGANAFSITTGSLTVTKAPKSFPERFIATFQFTASGAAGTRTVTMGSVSVWMYDPEIS